MSAAFYFSFELCRSVLAFSERYIYISLGEEYCFNEIRVVWRMLLFNDWIGEGFQVSVL